MSFLFGCQGRTDISNRILGAIYTVTKPIRHNPGLSPNQIISDYLFCGYPWLSKSEGGPFSLTCRDEVTLVLGFW